MNTTRKLCPTHGIPLARTFDLEYKKSVSMVRQVNVRYYCRVCRAKEEINKIKATIPKH